MRNDVIRLLRWVRNEEWKATEDEKGKGNTSTLSKSCTRTPAPSFPRPRDIYVGTHTPATITLCYRVWGKAHWKAFEQSRRTPVHFSQ